MAQKIKADFTGKTKPPTWSGNGTCKRCGGKNCSKQGGIFYENDKLECVNREFCWDCKKGETFDSRIR